MSAKPHERPESLEPPAAVRSAPGSRVVRDERDADGRLPREPFPELLDPVGTANLDPARVDDRRGEGGREILDRLDEFR